MTKCGVCYEPTACSYDGSKLSLGFGPAGAEIVVNVSCKGRYLVLKIALVSDPQSSRWNCQIHRLGANAWTLRAASRVVSAELDTLKVDELIMFRDLSRQPPYGFGEDARGVWHAAGSARQGSGHTPPRDAVGVVPSRREFDACGRRGRGDRPGLQRLRLRHDLHGRRDRGHDERWLARGRQDAGGHLQPLAPAGPGRGQLLGLSLLAVPQPPGAWDHPTWALKRFIDVHCRLDVLDVDGRTTERFPQASLLPSQLGWWVILGPIAIIAAKRPMKWSISGKARATMRRCRSRA